MAYHVLVVEDDPVTRSKLTGYFENAGYQVSEAEDGNGMRAIFAAESVDLILLDINLPGEDGLSLTRELRSQSDVGIMLVTGRTDTIDRIVGLEMGADDYITKPFELRELLARAKNLLWRIAQGKQANGTNETQKIFHFEDCTFNSARRHLSKNGQPIDLTRAEYEMLTAFIKHAGQVMSRDRLLNLITHRIWDPNDRTIDVLVRRLRSKLENDPKKPELIKTVHGEGYLFCGELH